MEDYSCRDRPLS